MPAYQRSRTGHLGQVCPSQLRRTNDQYAVRTLPRGQAPGQRGELLKVSSYGRIGSLSGS